MFLLLSYAHTPTWTATIASYSVQQFVGEDDRCCDKSRKNGRLGAGKSSLGILSSYHHPTVCLCVSPLVLFLRVVWNRAIVASAVLISQPPFLIIIVVVWSIYIYICDGNNIIDRPSCVCIATRVTRSRVLAAVDRCHGTDGTASWRSERPQGHCAVPHLVRPQNHHQHAGQWNVSKVKPGNGNYNALKWRRWPENREDFSDGGKWVPNSKKGKRQHFDSLNSKDNVVVVGKWLFVLPARMF